MGHIDIRAKDAETAERMGRGLARILSFGGEDWEYSIEKTQEDEIFRVYLKERGIYDRETETIR